MRPLNKLPVVRRVRDKFIYESNKLAGRAGFELKPTAETHWNLWQERISNASRARLFSTVPVDLVIDVGANNGQYGHSLRESGYTGDILSFEPQSQCVEHLATMTNADTKWTVVRAAVGAEPGSLALNVSGNSLSSSLLPMTHRHLNAAPESEYVRQESVEVLTLDGHLANSPYAKTNNIWLKIDTQGYEWPVILGATTTLEKVVAIEMELSFEPMYEGQKLFDEILPLLRQRGFAPHAFHEVLTDPKSKALYQVDGLFVRNSS